MKQESVELSALIEEQLKLDAGLLEQRGQHLVQELTQEITVIGDATLLGKVLGNLISNASLYSPNGAEIRVWCGWQDGCPAVLVENMGAHIGEDALPHLYEAFYREECSRNRTSGGSGSLMIRIMLPPLVGVRVAAGLAARRRVLRPGPRDRIAGRRSVGSILGFRRR